MANISVLSSGKWRVQFRHRGLRPVAKSFNGKAEAARWARLMESEFDRGVSIDRTEGERITIGELVDRYLVEITPAKKSASREVLRLHSGSKSFSGIASKSLESTDGNLLGSLCSVFRVDSSVVVLPRPAQVASSLGLGLT